jgi:hypothetical protein
MPDLYDGIQWDAMDAVWDGGGLAPLPIPEVVVRMYAALAVDRHPCVDLTVEIL